jgi:hopene-associated glycosyltransferase HpnB
MPLLVIAALAFAAWVYLLAARGGFWRIAPRDGALPAAPEMAAWPRVVVVIPARDEADVIAANVRSLLTQDYPGAFSLIVVDDHSSDETVAAVQGAGAGAPPGRLTVLAAPGLPDGWTGKLWALEHGIRHAEALPEPPEFLLLTDADIRHAGDTLTTLVSRARRDRLVLASLMARLNCESFAERALVPAFIFFFRMLYPFAWVNRLQRATAAAAGGCMLVHRQSLRMAGGMASIRGELIDDCALARLLKKEGPIWIGLTERVRSTRAYRSFGETRRMIARCAYTQLRCSPAWLAVTSAAMLVVFVAPPVIVLSGDGAARFLAALAWVGMACAFVPTLRFYRVSTWWGIALPAIAATYLLLTLESAWLHLRGRGGEWKGRIRGRDLRPASRSRG